ncbi:LamG domain-containing protein [Demequina rhizosphaerae]|uniref:LamG domain-containing protein n=1 Tax=Demequina rhizosphaerae TaxID=1638985 RepID=UPI0007841D57|nr:LamG domain-containing protein [Demequina rhizosphaerae]
MVDIIDGYRVPRRRSRATVLLTVTVVVGAVLAGCTTDDTPSASWGLENDGSPSAGDQAVTANGGYSFEGGALALDGLSGFAMTEGSGPVDTTAAFTVAAWVDFGRDPNPYDAAVSQVGNTAAAFYLGYADGAWDFTMKTADSSDAETTHRVSAGSPAPTVDTWVHLVGVYDEADDRMALYVDGTKAAEGEFDEPWQAEGPLTIGRSQSNGIPSDFWPGAIAQVETYARALDGDAIAALYESTRPTTAPPPLPEPDPSTYGDGILDGTWDYRIPRGEFFDFMAQEYAPDATGLSIRLGFDGGAWWQGVVVDGKLFLTTDHDLEGDGGTFTVDGTELTLVGGGGEVAVTYAWALDGDELALEVLEECEVPSGACVADPSQMDPVMVAITGNRFVKSGDDPTY